MSTLQPPAAAPAYRDQSTGLMVFGILQILLGGFMALMGPMILLSTMLPQPGGGGAPMGLRQAIPAAGLYTVLAAVGITIGIGSIRARRWAWALTVVLSWMWLIAGIASLVLFLFLAPNAFAAAQPQAKLPPQALLFMQIFMGGILGCIYVVLPGVFLLFYQRYAVRATCQWRDPQVRWTDRCPLPVLALSIMHAFATIQMPFCLAYGGVMPFFGTFLSGPVGAAVILLLSALLAWLAWGTYRLQIAAWWATLAFYIVGTISATMTFAQPNALKTMYEKMGMPPAQLEMMNKMGMAEMMSRGFVWFMPVAAILLLGYLLWVRRYFRAAEAEQEA
jgi:hypothetical protein